MRIHFNTSVAFYLMQNKILPKFGSYSPINLRVKKRTIKAEKKIKKIKNT